MLVAQGDQPELCETLSQYICKHGIQSHKFPQQVSDNYAKFLRWADLIVLEREFQQAVGSHHSCDYVFPEFLQSTLLIVLPFAWGSLIPRMPGLSAAVLKLRWKSRASRTNGLFWEHICPLCPGIKSLISQMPFSDLKATSIYSEGQFLNWAVLSWALNDPPVLKLCLILFQVGKVEGGLETLGIHYTCLLQKLPFLFLILQNTGLSHAWLAGGSLATGFT